MAVYIAVCSGMCVCSAATARQCATARQIMCHIKVRATDDSQCTMLAMWALLLEP